MILGSKHVGVILNVFIQKFYVCALVGVLIKWLYEMHGAMIKIHLLISIATLLNYVTSQIWFNLYAIVQHIQMTNFLL